MCPISDDGEVCLDRLRPEVVGEGPASPAGRSLLREIGQSRVHGGPQYVLQVGRQGEDGGLAPEQEAKVVRGGGGRVLGLQVGQNGFRCCSREIDGGVGFHSHAGFPSGKDIHRDGVSEHRDPWGSQRGRDSRRRGWGDWEGEGAQHTVVIQERCVDGDGVP